MNDETRLAQFAMVAEKLRAKLEAELAKLTLRLRARGLESKRVARSHLINQKGETVRGSLVLVFRTRPPVALAY